MIRGPQYFVSSWDSGLCLPSNWVTHDFGHGQEILLFNKRSLKTKLNEDNVVELHLLDTDRVTDIPLTRTLQNGLIMQATIWTPKTLLDHILNVAFQSTPFNNIPRVFTNPRSGTEDNYSRSFSEVGCCVYFNRYIYMHVSIDFSTKLEQGDVDHIRYAYCFCTGLDKVDPVIVHPDLGCVETDSHELQYFVDRMIESIRKILTDPGLYIPNYPEENVT